ncbi:Glycosyltransferase family 92 protein [Chlorella vulgaris]
MRKPLSHGSTRGTAVIGVWAILTALALSQGWGYGGPARDHTPQQQRLASKQQQHLQQQQQQSTLPAPEMPPIGRKARHDKHSGKRSSKFSSSSSSKHSSSSSRGDGPLTSDVSCARRPSDPPNITPREVDLQQQRLAALQQVEGQPPGGYVAACAIVKDQADELPEWLDYHRRLGVSHFYFMDDHSQPSLEAVLAPYIKAGVATHRALPEKADAQRAIRKATCHEPYIGHKQLMAYHLCLLEFGHRHQWMAFFDIDEFFVIMDNSSSLPAVLRDYEAYGGLGVNWRMFGSSGHVKRQPNTLSAYTKCYPPDHVENTLIKTVANLQYLARMAGPHDALFPPGYHTVNSLRVPVDRWLSAPADYSRLALHHYAIKSRQDFASKAARGDSMSDEGKIVEDFWERIEAGSTDNCTAGEEMLRRFGSGPADDKVQKPA